MKKKMWFFMKIFFQQVFVRTNFDGRRNKAYAMVFDLLEVFEWKNLWWYLTMNGKALFGGYSFSFCLKTLYESTNLALFSISAKFISKSTCLGDLWAWRSPNRRRKMYEILIMNQNCENCHKNPSNPCHLSPKSLLQPWRSNKLPAINICSCV